MARTAAAARGLPAPARRADRAGPPLRRARADRARRAGLRARPRLADPRAPRGERGRVSALRAATFERSVTLELDPVPAPALLDEESRAWLRDLRAVGPA